MTPARKRRAGEGTLSMRHAVAACAVLGAGLTSACVATPATAPSGESVTGSTGHPSADRGETLSVVHVVEVSRRSPSRVPAPTLPSDFPADLPVDPTALGRVLAETQARN